jgi:hypothetical protein
MVAHLTAMQHSPSRILYLAGPQQTLSVPGWVIIWDGTETRADLQGDGGKKRYLDEGHLVVSCHAFVRPSPKPVFDIIL